MNHTIRYNIMQNWNNLWDPKLMLDMMLSHYVNETTILFLSTVMFGLLLINALSWYFMRQPLKVSSRYIPYVEHLSVLKDMNAKFDDLCLRYNALSNESDIMRTTIANLERDMHDITRESEDTDTDYEPIHLLYHTPSGTILHSDDKCQYIITNSLTEVEVTDDLYEFLAKASMLCGCNN